MHRQSLDLMVTPFYINVKSLIENCATMEIISITVNTVGPTMSTYGPGAFLRIMLALLESTHVKESGDAKSNERHAFVQTKHAIKRIQAAPLNKIDLHCVIA